MGLKQIKMYRLLTTQEGKNRESRQLNKKISPIECQIYDNHVILVARIDTGGYHLTPSDFTYQTWCQNIAMYCTLRVITDLFMHIQKIKPRVCVWVCVCLSVCLSVFPFINSISIIHSFLLG